MGTYDCVRVPCPKCGFEELFQSKGGACLMRTFDLQHAPADVMSDVNRHAPYSCRECGTLFVVNDRGVPDEVTIGQVATARVMKKPMADIFYDVARDARATKKRVIIMRGVPGSGKSSKAFTHAYNAGQKGLQAITVSADDFFMKNGKYEFNPSKLQQAHSSCMKRFLDALLKELDLVIVDNTNTRVWEFEDYVKIALLAGYGVEIDEIKPESPDALKTFAERCIHGVPADKIKQMDTRWEDFDLATFCGRCGR